MSTVHHLSLSVARDNDVMYDGSGPVVGRRETKSTPTRKKLTERIVILIIRSLFSYFLFIYLIF